MISLGERVRTLRKSAELSQAELGSKLGLDTTTVSRIESGSAWADLSDRIRALAEALEVPIEALFEDGDRMEERELLRAFRMLNSIDKQSVIRHASALAENDQVRRIMK